jgi:hypothetical protein
MKGEYGWMAFNRLFSARCNLGAAHLQYSESLDRPAVAPLLRITVQMMLMEYNRRLALKVVLMLRFRISCIVAVLEEFCCAFDMCIRFCYDGAM